MKTEPAVEIRARNLSPRALNEKIRAATGEGASEIVLRDVLGQRYIAAGLGGDVRIDIHGIPGNDLACFMAGPRLTVHGNAQDGVANTMSFGRVAIHGHAGDVLAYSMRGGKVFVRDGAGYRAAIHMKAFRDRSPAVVIGGTVRDYAGEYMAGGLLVVLGLRRGPGEPVTGEYLGTGMHGGEIFLRGEVEPWRLGREVGPVPVDDAAWDRLRPLLEEYAAEFGADPAEFPREGFTRLVPVSHRPYGKVYVY